MLRIVTLLGMLFGALSFAQFPAFSQQYVQRLGGALDELTRVVSRFEASARAAGLSQDEALAEMAGSAFMDEQRRGIERDIARQSRLQKQAEALQNASALQRLAMPHQFADTALLRATWADFEPAFQLTSVSALIAAIGAGLGGLGCRGCGVLAWRVLRRKRKLNSKTERK